MPVVQVFLYLQVLDFLTTMVGFKIGVSEASPFILKLIHFSSSAIGVAASKAVALAIAGICVTTGRVRMLTWANYWYAALIVWNLSMILSAMGRAH